MTKETKNVPSEKKPGSTALAAPGGVNLPDGFEEGIDKEALTIPRAKIVQAISPEHTEDKIEIGKIINSLTQDELPKTFIPLFKFTFWIRFNPRKRDDVNFDPVYEPVAQIYRTDDPHDRRLEEDAAWGPNGEQPKATKLVNFLAMFEGKKTPIVISFARTSMKAGKRLYSLAMDYALENNEPMYARAYRLTAKGTSTDGNKYFVAEVAPAGKVADENIAQLKELHKLYSPKAKTIDVHDVSGDNTEKEVWDD